MFRFWSVKMAIPCSELIAVAVVATSLLAGCEGESPRSYSEYLEDPIAREATISRCNAAGEGARVEAECINAKRAAAALAAQGDGDKRKRFAAQSERKREALRERIAAQQANEQRIQADAQRRATSSYEQNWASPESGGGGPEVYTPPQFPAEPLQPGMSGPTDEPSSNLSPNYPGDRAQPGYSLGSGAVEAVSAAEPPQQALPADSASPSTEDPPQQSQQQEDPSAADPSWQPFEPPTPD